MIYMYEERKSLEVLLDRTSQLYRQAHGERRNLVNTWKDAVNQMNQREKDIRDIEKVLLKLFFFGKCYNQILFFQEINKAKAFTQNKLKILQKEETSLNIQREENFELELLIQELNIGSSDLKNRFNKLEEAINLKSSEVR